MQNKTEEEFIPLKSERQLAKLFRIIPIFRKNKELQKTITDWAKEMLTEARAEWCAMRAITIESVIKTDRKQQATNRGTRRDEKYVPFREYFKNLQRQRYISYKNAGQKMTANGFVRWFLENPPQDIKIPYCKENQKNKLIQLAQANNREFKKAFE